MINSGRPGVEISSTIHNRKKLELIRKIKGSTLTILIQTSNFMGRSSGLVNPLQFGTYKHLSNKNLREKSQSSIVLGAILIMALYHFFLFGLRRKDKASLYFGLFSMLVVIRFSVQEALLINWTRYESNFIFKMRSLIEYLDISLLSPFFILFLKEILGREMKLFQRLVIVPSSLYFFIIIFTEIQIYNYLLYFYEKLVVLFCVFFVSITIFEVKKGNKNAKLVLLAGMILVITSVNDILHASSTISTSFLMPYGFLAFLFTQSFIISRNFANAQNKAEYLRENLKKEVDEQTISLRKSKEKAEESEQKALERKAEAESARKTAEKASFEAEQATAEALMQKNLAEMAKSEADRLKAEAEKQAIKLKELDKQKTHFFQNISHELRTPLTLIMNPAEQAEAGKEVSRNVSVINKNAKRLYRLVNQLLDFQKISAGKKKLDSRPVDMVQFIKASGEYFAPSCEAKNIEFAVTLNKKAIPEAGAKKIFVKAEVDALEKIVFNYLSNALKYTPDGGKIELGLKVIKEEAPKMRPSATASDGSDYMADLKGFKGETELKNPLAPEKENQNTAQKEEIILFVKDDGPGINAEGRKKLFKVFSQVDESTTRKYEGTGLGLALVKELAQAMSGSVGVDSKPGRGSSFFAKFPVSRPPKKLKDLLVVHSAWKGRFFRSCEIAKGAGEARELLNEFDFKCLIIDQTLNDQSGFDFLSEAESLVPEAKKVMILDTSDNAVLKEAIGIKAIDLVVDRPWDDDINEQLVIGIIDSSKIEESAEAAEIEIKDWHMAEKTEEKESGIDIDDISGQGELILIADDIKDMRALIASAVKEKNYRVIGAENGKEALLKAREHKPDLVITDWMMPIMSGPDFIKELRKDHELSSVPTILLTAKSDEESKFIGTDLGADGFLGKPFNDQELTSMVRNLLQLKSSEQKVLELNRHITENVLERYLPRELVEDILAGKLEFTKEPKTQNLTVLFSDLAGFTELSTKLRAKKMSKILNEYLNEMIEIISWHGGTIDKFIGDAIMVFWGAPKELGDEEQAMKATACAREMQKALESLSDDWQKDGVPGLKMRIGINHGPAIVGNFGNSKRSDYSAIGPEVNLASRIESVCTPGETFLSGTICDLIGEDQFTEAGNFELKGLPGETPLYKLI